MQRVASLALAVLAAGCGTAADVPDASATAQAPVRFTPDDTAGTSPDTTLTAKAPPRALAIVLPAPPGGPLGPRAATLAERAVFVPRTTRWFIARRADSTSLAADIGRMDDPVAAADSLALAAMLAQASPVQPGLRVVVHGGDGPRATAVTRLAVQGRRIVAIVPGDTSAGAYRVIGVATDSTAPRTATRCEPGDATAIAATIDRLLAGSVRADRRSAADSAARRATSAGAPARGSALTGCFGAFRALAVRRPAVATPDVTEKAWLVRPDGTARAVRLRDLSYPLHDLLAAHDTDGDGIDELLVRSHRPAMETIAALRLSDSVTFTRFVNGFTIERR